jgi:hypothetical protein
MGDVLTQASGLQLPTKPIRAAMLAFLGSLAVVEIGAGAVVAQAWKVTTESGALSLIDRYELDQLLERLRVLEGVVVMGAVCSMVLWSLVASYNAAQVMRRGLRDVSLAAAACVAGPVAALVLGVIRADMHSQAVALLLAAVQAVALYVPFVAMAVVAGRVGAPRGAFGRWYLLLAAALLVQRVFTAPLELSTPTTNDNLGRTAVMYFVNGLVLGVSVLMAADATRGLQRSISDRLVEHRVMHDDAHLRVRASVPITPVS